ncbi:MAG: HepT-like ribonuclease domain-containing protein [Chloroflexota bacterium]
MTWRDDAYFLDMLLAADQLIEFANNLSREAFDESKLHQLAMVRLIEIIGEAAKNISDEARNAHPEIEWSNIIGMRNRIVHNYSNVDLDIVWDVITIKAPELIQQLKTIVPPDKDTPENK